MLITTDAFIIKRRTYREYDKVITLYTPGLGKIEAAAIGTKKPLSKLAGNLEPLSHVRVQLAQVRGLARIAQVVAKTHLLRIFGGDLDALIWAQKACALIDKLVAWKERQSGIYEEMERYFELMRFAHEESVSQTVAPVITLGFGWRIVALLGYKPVLILCVSCGVKIGSLGGRIFNIAGGGFTCMPCAAKIGAAHPVCELVPGAKQFLADLIANPLDNLLNYTYTREDFMSIRELFNLFVRYHFPSYVN